MVCPLIHVPITDSHDIRVYLFLYYYYLPLLYFLLLWCIILSVWGVYVCFHNRETINNGWQNAAKCLGLKRSSLCLSLSLLPLFTTFILCLLRSLCTNIFLKIVPNRFQHTPVKTMASGCLTPLFDAMCDYTASDTAAKSTITMLERDGDVCFIFLWVKLSGHYNGYASQPPNILNF